MSGARVYTLESTDASIGTPAAKLSINISFDWRPVQAVQEEDCAAHAQSFHNRSSSQNMAEFPMQEAPPALLSAVWRVS